MADPITLRDGTTGWVWPLLQTDKEALIEEFEKLSPESRRRRFLSPVMHLSEEMVRHLVDDVDGVDHIALVLMVEADPEDPELVPVAIARIVRYPDHPSAADLAVTVKDDWHGRGCATALLKVLLPMRPVGVTHIVTEVVEDNPASLAMLKALGPTTVTSTGMGVLDVEVDLSGSVAEPVPSADGLPEPERSPWRDRLRARDRLCRLLTSAALWHLALLRTFPVLRTVSQTGTR